MLNMPLIRDTVSTLRVTRHASVALAFRYGLVCENPNVNFYYQNKGKDNDDGTLTVKGVIENEKVQIVVDVNSAKIITALPIQQEFKTKVGAKARDVIEGAFWGSESFTLQHVAELRGKFLGFSEQNAISSLRKEISLISKSMSAIPLTKHPDDSNKDLPVNNDVLREHESLQISLDRDPWITGDELYFLRIPEEEWPTILGSPSLESLANSGITSDLVLRLTQYKAHGDKTHIEKLYELNSVDSSLNVSGRPLKDFLIELDPNQKAVLSKIKDDGPYLIKGGAGTGKSIVGLYHIRDLMISRTSESLFDEDVAQYGVITYTNTLVDANSAILENILPGNVKADVHHTTLDKIVFRLASMSLGLTPRAIVNKRLDSSGISSWLSRYIKPMLSSTDCEICLKLGWAYIADEIEEVIYGNNLSNIDDYLSQNRIGRKRGLRANERKSVWNCFRAFSSFCKQRGGVTFGLLRVIALKKLQEDSSWPRYNALFVDEAQDLSKVSRLICLELVKDPKSLLMAADTAQSIYTIPPTWKETHKVFDFRRRRPLRLEKSYRSTAEISEAITPLRLDLGDDDDKSSFPEPVRSGPKPFWVEVPMAKQVEEVCSLILSYTKKCQNPVNAGQIAVIVPDNKRAKFYDQYLRSKGVSAQIVSKKNPIVLSGACVHIVTAHSSKGLSFPIVIVPDVNDEFYPTKISLDRCSDEQQIEQVLEKHQRLLYVALSRASSFLHMIVDTDLPSRFVKKLSKSEYWE